MGDSYLHSAVSRFADKNVLTGVACRNECLQTGTGTAVTDSLTNVFLRGVNENQFHICIPAFAFVCLLMLIGLPGNVLSILVYATQLKKGVARYFILTLAVSDLITLIYVAPVELWIMKHFWNFDYPNLCKSFRFIAYTVNNVSSLSLLVIAFERYRIICSPWKQKFTAMYSKIVCVLITMISIATSIPMLFTYGTYTMPLSYYSTNLQKESHQNISVGQNITYPIFGKTCMVDDNMASSLFPFYVNIVYIAATVAVFCVLIYLYGCIARQLIIQRMQNKNKHSKKRYSKRVKHVTIMVFILTVVYEVCYLPCLTIVCLRLINPYLYKSLNDAEKAIYQFFLKSYFINSAINPCIYCFCNKEFRAGVCHIFNKLKMSCSKDEARRLSESCLT